MTPEWKWIKDYISLKEANSGDLVLPLRPGNADPTDKECESESLMVVCKSIRIGGLQCSKLTKPVPTSK